MVESSEPQKIIDSSLPRLVLITTPLSSPDILLEKLHLKRPDNFDPKTNTWNITTKYYSAKIVVEKHCLELNNSEDIVGVLDHIPNKEAFVYYFTSEEEIASQWLHQSIDKIQNEFSPEIGLLFYNGGATFSSKTDGIIDKVVQSSFLEYVSEKDLAAVGKGDKNTGGLLGQDEKRGFERLIEALECSMWSNMQTKSNPVIKQVVKAPSKSDQDLKPVDVKPAKEEKVLPESTEDEQKEEIPGLVDHKLSAEEQDADSILHLMQEINQLKDRNKQLSDEERRKNAESMITRLAQMMDLDESDYDEELDKEAADTQ